MTARGVDSLIGPVLADWPEDAPELAITTRVACADYFEVRDRAFLTHATQADPEHPFFAHPRDIEREVWPTEDYHLARCLVDTTLPEADLFAGVRGQLGSLAVRDSTVETRSAETVTDG